MTDVILISGCHGNRDLRLRPSDRRWVQDWLNDSEHNIYTDKHYHYLGRVDEHGLTSFPTCMINNIRFKMCGDIIYPFPNFLGGTVLSHICTWKVITDPSSLSFYHLFHQLTHFSCDCLTAPSQYVNQLWLISTVLYHSSKDHSTGNADEINHDNAYETCTLTVKATSPSE